MKKIFTFILSVALLLSVIPFNTLTANAETETGKFENFTYQISYGTITITGYEYDGSEPAEVIIPSEIAGYPVTTIRYLDIVSDKNIKSIYIPKSVTMIYGPQYSGDINYVSLESIEIEPGNLIYHSSGNCIIQTAEKQLIFGSNKSMIPTDGSVVHIGSYAFFGCSSLKIITVPNNITIIDRYAFTNCSSLESMIIPDSVVNIGDSAFSGCISLKNITIPNGITSIAQDTFSFCGSLENIIIPSSVTSIYSNAFCDCVSLKSIIIPNGVTDISDNTFGECSSLESITLPESVMSIGYCAFIYCSSLKKITIPNGVVNISSGAFYGCSSLENITIPNGVVNIGHSAFSGCSSLKSISLPDNVTSIDDYAFYNCNLLESITIPDGVMCIGDRAFGDCYSLKNLFFSKSLKAICNGAFLYTDNIENIYYEGSEEEWNAVTILPNNDALKKANIHFNSAGIPGEAPTAPELLKKTACTVTLKHIDGYEYRLNDGEWQSSNIFTGLNPNTEYKFYRRTAASDESPAGAVSYALTVVTSEIIRGDINDDRDVNILDLICLKKFFADPLNNVVPSACLDVSGDGRINSADLAALRKNLLFQ